MTNTPRIPTSCSTFNNPSRQLSNIVQHTALPIRLTAIPSMALPASRRSGGKSGKYRVLRHRLWPVVINSLPFIIISLYVQLAPHTKVEESFYLHAIHDGGVLGLPPRNETLRSVSGLFWQGVAGIFLFYFLKAKSLWILVQWDHIAHPGPVPRSFMPVWLWVALSQYLTWACSQLGLVHTGVGAQKLGESTTGRGSKAPITEISMLSFAHCGQSERS